MCKFCEPNQWTQRIEEMYSTGGRYVLKVNLKNKPMLDIFDIYDRIESQVPIDNCPMCGRNLWEE